MTDVSINDALQNAIAHHQAGRLSEAEDLYRAILAKDPNHADALHLLGVIAAAVSQHEQAVNFVRRAISINPRPGVYYSNLATFLRELKRTDEALMAVRQAIMLDPNHAQAHNNLANLLADKGRFEESYVEYRRAIDLKPDYAEAHSNLGTALNSAGNPTAAIPCFQRALELNPNFADAANNLGVALKAAGRRDEARHAFQRTAALHPNNAAAHYNLGTILSEQGQIDLAIEEFRRAIQINPRYAEAYSNLANALKDKQFFNDAIAAYRRAIEIKPDYAEAHFNLGTAFQEMGRLDDAINCFRLALQYRPTLSEAHVNLGAAMHERGGFQESREFFEKAAAPNAEFADAHWNLALALLLAGEFEQGWKEYEWRWHLRSIAPTRRHADAPRWDGSDPAGKTILVSCEQGFGDAFQFVRYLPLLKARGATILLECLPSAARLLKSMPAIAQVIERDEPLPPFDLHIPLLSLPLAFKTTLQSIPAEIPYLSVDAELVDAWRARLAPFDNRLKVGIAWSGNPEARQDQKRSMLLKQFAPLASLPNVALVSLQKGQASEQTKYCPPGMELIDFTSDLTDFSETAGLMMNLDLIISVDTAVVHLAGALGKKIWTLIPYVPDWRWMLERTDSPWYPTMKLFRQPRLDDWTTVVEHVKWNLEKVHSE